MSIEETKGLLSLLFVCCLKGYAVRFASYIREKLANSYLNKV